MMGTRKTWLGRIALGVVAFVASTAMVVVEADARGGRGGSVGSRGSKTFQAPPTTTTAPKPAAPVQKSITQPGKASPAVPAANTSTLASRFGGVKGLLLGGLIGAGLASMFGFGGGLAAVLGFMLQMLLVAGIIMLIISFFRSRRAAPATATAAPVQARSTEHEARYRNIAGQGAGTTEPPLAIVGDDFNAFERLLGEVQTAYGQGDLKTLETRLTPEMLSYFAQELADNRQKSVRNEIHGVKLLQGDLAESWREPGVEYATVAMRYAIADATVDLKTGQVVAGSRTEPQEATEVWTFVRPHLGNAQQWELSAIQQA